MMCSTSSQRGFTLIELMLAMALFATIMIITTAGFVGINRTYTRGTIRKQLSESVQRLEASLSATLRANQQSGVLDPCSTGQSGCLSRPSGYTALCLTGARYVWGSVGDNSGLFVDNMDCADSFDSGAAVELVDQRYIIEYLRVIPLVSPGLYNLEGGVRTVDDAAFTTSDGDLDDINLPIDYDRSSVRCKGSSAGSVVQTCAIEHFSTVVNTRGAAL